MDKKALYIFIIIFCLLISGCAQREGQSVDEILVRLMEVSGENIEDSGSFYFSCATEGEIGYFSNDNKKLMYGEDSTEQIFDKIESYAIYVSARVPSEIGVFKCYSSSDTDRIARMCLERADSIKVLLKNSEWGEKSKGICVSIHKRYVLFSFAENSENVQKMFRKLI